MHTHTNITQKNTCVACNMKNNLCTLLLGYCLTILNSNTCLDTGQQN